MTYIYSYNFFQIVDIIKMLIQYATVWYKSQLHCGKQTKGMHHYVALSLQEKN